MRTQTTDRFLVEDLEDLGRTGELANDRINDELTEPLVKGHEDIFYGYEFAIQGGGETGSRVSPSRRPSASSRTSSAQAPRTWAEQAFPNIIYVNQVDEGNHITAWQEPDIFTTEVRAGFRSLRDGRSSS